MAPFFETHSVYIVYKKLSYCKQIARKLRTQYVEGIYSNFKILKTRLRVIQGHWKWHRDRMRLLLESSVVTMAVILYRFRNKSETLVENKLAFIHPAFQLARSSRTPLRFFPNFNTKCPESIEWCNISPVSSILWVKGKGAYSSS